MDFPARPPRSCPAPQTLLAGLGHPPTAVLAADDYLAVYEHEAIVRSLAPNLAKLQELDRRGVIITAPGEQVDFVSRFFAPKLGVPEDPVTGSAHCTLTPYWAQRFGKTDLEARQVSKRGGNLRCQLQADRVILSGSAVTVLMAELDLGPSF